MILLPRIIENGKPKESVRALAASINLTIRPLSSATITLTEGTQIGTRTFMELFTETGSVGVFRTRTPRVGIGNQSTTVELEHAIADLGDYLITADLEKEMTLGAAAKEIFKYYKGTNWKLGKIAKSTTKVVLKASYDTCLDALLDILDQEPTTMLTFSFAAHPWTVTISERPTTVTAEGRLARNVRSATITKDDTELCTRVYLDGLPRTKAEEKAGTYGHLDASTIKKYGVVEREINGPNENETQAKRTASIYLEKHKEPRYSIQIDAFDLSKITGETLDRFSLGKKMRLALPDYGITVEEVITQISWSSVYGQPSSTTITLSDEEDTILQTIKSASKSGKSASKTTAKKAKEYETRITQNENNIEIWAGHTEKNGKILEEAGIYIDAKGILHYVKDKKNGIYSTIEQRAKKIETTITNTKTGLETKISQTDSKITAEVTRAKGQEKTISGRVTVTESKVGMVVEEKNGRNVIKAAEIAVSINNSTGESEAKINADHVYIGNDKSTTVINGKCKLSDVTADYINGKIATIPTLTGIGGSFSGNVTAAGLIGTQIYVKVDGSNVNISNPVLEIRTDPTDTHTIQYKRADSSAWEVLGTFDTATSLSGAWSGNTYTVTASPQGNTKSVTPVVHVITSQGAAYADIKVATATSGGSGFDDHGSATRLYLVKSGLTVYLKDANSTGSGTVYAQTTCTDPHSSSMAIRQVSGYQSARKMKLYWADNTVTTIPSGFHAAYSSDTYWYRSGTDLNQTGSNKTVYY